MIGSSGIAGKRKFRGCRPTAARVEPTGAVGGEERLVVPGLQRLPIGRLNALPNGRINQAGDSHIGDGSGQCLELIGSQVTLAGGSALASSCNIPGVENSGSSGLVSLVQ